MKHFNITAKSLVTFGVVMMGLTFGSKIALSEELQTNYSQQNAYSQQPLVSRIQVSGSTDKMSVDVEHGDLVSVFKAVMKQGQKMFTPDATVSGQVTLSLSDQPLASVLKAICEQSYLKYQVKDGIYKFTRDDDAIKVSFTKLKELNLQLRQQLRSLGMELPDDANFDMANNRAGFGGGKANAKSMPLLTKDKRAFDSPLANAPQAPQEVQKARDSVRGNSVERQSIRIKSEQLSRGDKIATPNGFVSQSAGDNLELNDSKVNGNNTLNGLSYQEFLERNKLVYFNIPSEKPQPVSSVLQSIGQQANVPIFLDQSIPNSLKFRIWGNLSPRQLNDALNTITPRARLQWRWVGNTVYVVPAPDFQLAFGDNIDASQKLQYRGNYLQLPNNQIPSAPVRKKP